LQRVQHQAIISLAGDQTLPGRRWQGRMLDVPAASWLKSGMSHAAADRAAIHLRNSAGFYRLDAFRAAEDALNPIDVAYAARRTAPRRLPAFSARAAR
jgi:hypothetical protein